MRKILSLVQSFEGGGLEDLRDWALWRPPIYASVKNVLVLEVFKNRFIFDRKTIKETITKEFRKSFILTNSENTFYIVYRLYVSPY